MRIIFHWSIWGCQASLTTAKRMTDPWADGSGHPRSRQPIPLGFPWGLHGAHSHILTWTLLAHHDQIPYHAIKSLVYVKVIPIILDPSLYKEIPLYQRIWVSSLPLYKPQTLPFLRYMNSPYLLHSWVLEDSSIIDLTFRVFLANTPSMPFD